MARRAALGLLDDATFVDAFGQRYVQQEDIIAEAAPQSSPGLAHAAAAALVSPLRAVSGFLSNGFDLNSDAYLVGNIKVNVTSNPALPEPFAGLELPLQQGFALMTDAWNSGTTNQVRTRTGGLVPTSRLARLQSMWQPLMAPLGLVEPSLLRLCLGIIEPDRVPEDRLGAGRTALPGRCP